MTIDFLSEVLSSGASLIFHLFYSLRLLTLQACHEEKTGSHTG